ncbi:MAG TPA: hypothetical protein G4N93_06900 [Dehalococcoidia bacterium]|nr:hypothetical protein [Dehalococcoidia bacterium]
MPLDKDKVKSLISTGSDIAGAATGGAIGFLTGGPGGAAIGGSLGVIISKGLSDIADRLLSNREKIRVGATVTFALTKIKSRLDSGHELRNDGFFEDKERGRADAEEIFEGVLLKAKNEHEEKKTKILGNIFANTAFFPGFSVGEANHLLRIAENLTYREMCTLSLVHRKEKIPGIKLRECSYVDDIRDEKKLYGRSEYGTISNETMSMLQEAYEICDAGLMVCKVKHDEVGGAFWTLLGWADVVPDDLELTEMGERFYQVMGLDDIPEEDIREVSRYLS